MVIEITKKHVIAAIVGLTVGVGIGIGVVMLVNHDSPSKNQTEITSSQAKTTETPKQEVAVQENQESTRELSTYRNARFGFSIRYPSTWVKGKESVNGDGCIISPQDGTIEVTVSGSNNTLNETSQNAYYRTLNIANQKGILGFHTLSEDWYVVTYSDGTFIYYVKGFVGAGSENTLYIKYLQSKKEQYQDVIQQLENGFNHGSLDTGY